MNLDRFLALLAESGARGAAGQLVAACAQAPDDESLTALRKVLDMEVSALAGWQEEMEPSFALQQIRNRAVACGFPTLAADVEKRLEGLGLPWLAETQPVEPANDELLLTLTDGPCECAVLDSTGKRIELRDEETGELLAAYGSGTGTIPAGPSGRNAASKPWTLRKIRDLASGKIFFELPPADGKNRQLSPDGSFVARGKGESTGFDGEYFSSFTVEIWDPRMRTCFWSKNGSADTSGGLTALVISPDSRFVAAIGCSVLSLWNSMNGDTVGEWPSASIQQNDLCFTPDGRRLVMNNRRALQVHELGSGEVRHIDVREEYINTIAISPDGKRIAGVGGGWLRLWDLTSGEETLAVQLSGKWDSAVWFLAESRCIAVSPERGRIELIEPHDGKRLCSFDAHANSVSLAAATPDWRYLVTAGGREINVWDLPALCRKKEVRARGCEAFEMQMTPDGSHAALVKRPSVSLVRLNEENAEPEILWEEPEIPGLSCSVMSPDGTWLLCGSSDGSIRRFPIGAGSKTEQKGTVSRGLGFLAWSPAGDRIAACFDGSRILEVWNADPGPGIVGSAPPQRLTFRKPAKNLAFSPDGRLLATAHEDGVRVIDAADAASVTLLGGWADRVAVSADGFVLVSRRLRTTEVWNLATNRMEAEGRAEGYYGSALSPDGRWALAETGSGRLTVETRQPGQARLEKVGEIAGSISDASDASRLGVVFSRDGEHVVTSMGWEGLALWHLPTCRQIARIRGSLDFIGMAVDYRCSRITANDRKLRVHFLKLCGPRSPC